MTKKIIDCPICGGQCRSQGKTTGHWKIVCRDCGLMSPDSYYNENGAIKYWNSRCNLKSDPGGIKKGIELVKVTEEDSEVVKKWANSPRQIPTLSTPNCSICEWRNLEEPFKPVFGPPNPPKNNCTAQGDRYIKNVYGNKICKRLFKKIESVTKDAK